MITTDSPIKDEFMLKINIVAYSGKQTYRLMLHTEERADSRTNLYLDYQDLVKEGDIIEQKLPKILKEDFGITKIKDLELIENPLENTEDEDTDPFDYQLWVEVDLDQSYAGKIGDMYVSWFELDEE